MEELQTTLNKISATLDQVRAPLELLKARVDESRNKIARMAEMELLIDNAWVKVAGASVRVETGRDLIREVFRMIAEWYSLLWLLRNEE